MLQLSRMPGATASELQEALHAAGIRFERRSIYKELGHLIDEEIVGKIKTRYFLRLTWIYTLHEITERARELYSDPRTLSELVPTLGEKVCWRFSSLRMLDIDWSQLLLALHTRHPEKTICLWAPYRWFRLVHSERSASLTNAWYQKMKEKAFSGAKRLNLYGADAFLARHDLYKRGGNVTYDFSFDTFKAERSKYYSVLGSHVITMTLSKSDTDRLERLFDLVKNEEDLVRYREHIQREVAKKVTAKLVWEQNEKRAAQLRRKFARHFHLAEHDLE